MAAKAIIAVRATGITPGGPGPKFGPRSFGIKTGSKFGTQKLGPSFGSEVVGREFGSKIGSRFWTPSFPGACKACLHALFSSRRTTLQVYDDATELSHCGGKHAPLRFLLITLECLRQQWISRARARRRLRWHLG